MKYLSNLLLLVLLTGCSEVPDEETQSEEQQVQETPVQPPTVDSNTVVDPSSAAAPIDSLNQLHWYDSLLSDNQAVRIEAINRYKDVRTKPKTEFENSELLTGYLKTFLSAYPQDFLIAYSAMKPAERTTLLHDVAYEFYTAGNEYKSYLDEYFNNIESSCNTCSEEHKTMLKDIRQKVEADVKKKNG